MENLQALREVALRQVAEDVESKRLVREPLAVREEHLFGSSDPRPIAERLMALVTLDEADERVIRRAWRSAQRLGAELDILLPRDAETQPTAGERERLESLRRLASVLGAHLLVEEGERGGGGRAAGGPRARHDVRAARGAGRRARPGPAPRAAGPAARAAAAGRGRPARVVRAARIRAPS